jgi:hypothetical protein
MNPPWQTLNQSMWNAKVPQHLASTTYDVAGFKAGRCTLRRTRLTTSATSPVAT